MTTIEDKPLKTKKQKFSESEILSEVYIQQGKPENIIKAVAINTFDNHYRVNIWESINHPFMPKAGKIVASYFVTVYDSGEVVIKQ